MIARKYNKRIEILPFITVQNQFAGTVVGLEEDTFMTWAEIVTNGVGYKVEQFGLQLFENPVMFKCRFRNDLDFNGREMVVKYKGDYYVIKGVKNVDLSTTEVEIYTQKLEGNFP